MKFALSIALSMALMGLVYCATSAQSQLPQEGGVLHDNYIKQWAAFCEQFEPGMKGTDAKGQLEYVGQFLEAMRLGGSGRTEWVCRLDDVSELIVLVDKDDVLVAKPRMRPISRWLKFPDGGIVEAIDEFGN